MSLYSHTTRAVGLILTAAIYNADHVNHCDSQTALLTEGYSPDVATMRTVTSPGTVGSESLATSVAGEIARLRYAIQDTSGGAQWYSGPSVVNVRSPRYGAAGDGATDDTAAIQAAIDVAGPHIVFFPPLTYNTTGVDIISRTGVVLWGPGATLYNTKVGYNDALHVYTNYAVSVSSGAALATTVLTAQGTVGDTTIALTSAVGFAIGQDIIINDSRFFEANKIINLVGLTATLARPLENTYTVARGAQTYTMNFSRNISIRDLAISGTVGAGTGVVYVDVLDSDIQRVKTANIGGRGVLVAGASSRILVDQPNVDVPSTAAATVIGIETYIHTSHVTIRDPISLNARSNGISMHGFHQTLVNPHIMGSGAAGGASAAAVHMDTGEDITISGGHLSGNIGMGIGISGAAINTTEATGVKLIGVTVKDNGGDGVSAGSGGNVNLIMEGCDIDRNRGTSGGVYLNAMVAGSVIRGNRVRRNTNNGVTLDGANPNLILSGNNFTDGSTTVNGGNDLKLNGGASLTNSVVTDNVFGAATPISGAIAATTRVWNNVGWVTQNRVTATITSGNDSVSVAHGLSVTPLESWFTITALAWGNAAKVWVDSVTATDVVIHVDVDPGVTGAIFRVVASGW